MITLEILHHWLVDEPEGEHLEFKEAHNQYNTEKLMEYCVALANERGGHLVLGVSDKSPRRVVGTEAFPNLADIKARILNQLHFRVDITELHHSDGRVLVFDIPSRPIGHPMHFNGCYLMRAGESLVSMTPDQLRRIFSEGEPNWFMQAAKSDMTANDVVSHLDTQAYFDLLKQPYIAGRNENVSKAGIARINC